ncbi:HAUS augmin-like complex subunit 6 isoform X2 [Scyliorhinus torazame]|uniref:HAUS augmin-like complex subunit 6 isoform X2 n=1 Tax=Scyliorhinus torazame TaxID=75743 RepID=UPI003B59EA66
MSGGWRKERFWSALLALGFSPPGAEAPTQSGSRRSRTAFGRDMFEKPNMEAFQVVAHYLFIQLDQTRANSLFRDCWPVYDKKRAACFRKVCFEWMKKIVDEVGNAFPQVTASLFLSPGGPKFINVMYHFIKYVLLCKFNEVQKGDTWKTMTFGGKPQDAHLMAMKSCIAASRFLEGIQKEAFVVEEYKRRESLLAKENAALRKEYAELKSRVEKGACDFAEARFQKQEELREMWDIVMDTLSKLEKEKEVIDSLVEGRVDLYTLDGADVTLKVPRQLIIKIEGEADQIGDLYKAGKLNLAAVIQLCNWCLRLHGDQHNQVGPAELDQHHLTLEKLAEFLKSELIEMKKKGQKITQEVLPSVKASVAKMESTWDKKWVQYSSRTGYSPVRRKYPVLDLLPSMPPLSFEPASEEAYQSSIFYTHSATLPGAFRKGFEEPCISSDKGDSGTGSITRSFDLSTSKLQCSGRSNVTAGDPTEETQIFSCLGEESVEMPLEMHPLESNLQTPFANRQGRLQTDQAVNPELLNKPKNVLKKREEQPRKAVDQLAEKIADTVSKDSPGLSEKEDVTHDSFVSMTNNPFIAQTELSRTPENLITEIRNSWRCAVQESELAQRKHQEEPVLMHPECENHTNGKVQPEESSSVTCINLTGSINRNTPPDPTVLCFGETQSWIVPPVKRMTCWSENTLNPDAEPTSSNCQSIRNEKRNQFLKPDRLWEEHVYQCDWEESRIGFSDIGSDHEPHCFSDKVTDCDTNEALGSKILPPPDSQLMGFGEDCHFASQTNVISNATLTDETESNHSLQFLAFNRLRSKSPIKKEKLSKGFVMEMCKNEKMLENSFSSFAKCDLDGTLPWNGSENISANLSSSTKPTVQPRFGILQETIPDLLDIDSLNSSKTMEVDQLDESHLDMQHLRSRLEQLRQHLATTLCGGEKEHMGASDCHGDSDKDQNKPLYGEIDYLNEEIDAGKLFSLETQFLKDLSPMSLESQKFSLFPTLGSSPLNDPELEDGLIGISDLRPSNSEPESPTDWERFSTDVGKLITF